MTAQGAGPPTADEGATSGADGRQTSESLRATAPPQASIPEPVERSLPARVWSLVAVPLGAIVLSLFVGAIVMILSEALVSGRFEITLPIEAYRSLVLGSMGNGGALVSTVVQATPLVLAGLAVGICFKAGLFNIGAQGQFLMGALTAGAVGASLAQSGALVAVTVALVAAAVAGALYGAIPGFLKAFTGAHEVVTTIMLNYIAIFTIAYLVSGPLRAPGASFARTAAVGDASLPIIIGRDGHIGLLIALAAVPLAYWLLWRTTLGFEIRTVGANPEAARYAGMRPRRLVVMVMTFGGLLAGLAGAGEILGRSGFMPAAFTTNVGFDAITVALLGRAHPAGILLAGLLFGAMRAGANQMQIVAGVPSEMIDVLQGVILLFLAADIVVRRVFRLRGARMQVSELQTVTRSYGEQASR